MKRKTLIILASLVLVFFSALPGAAHAQQPSGQSLAQFNGMTACEQQAELNSRTAVQARMLAAQGVYGNMAQLDAALYQCLDKIQGAFDMLDNTIPHSNPFTSAILNGVKAMAWNILLQILNQACTMIANDIKQIEMFALSQINRLCIPLPSLNLGIGGLHLPMAQCHGVNLVGPMLGLANLPGSGTGTWNVWNLKAR